MAVTVLVEPDPGGHRFQAVANVARVAARSGDVVLLTSRGATALPAYAEYLADLDLGPSSDLRVVEVFNEIYPPTREMAMAAADLCRADDVETVVVMDADQSLKRWWYSAPAAFRDVPTPRVVFMLTRYPAKLRLRDVQGWKLRTPKAALALAAITTGSLAPRCRLRRARRYSLPAGS